MDVMMNIYRFFELALFFVSKKSIESIALITRKRFYCLSLQGKSNYGISINSDLTVSCNCSNVYGPGHIGNLKKQTMHEIFSSDKVASFKKKLANRKLPIMDCAICQNLRKTKKEINSNNYQLPKWILLENTVNCNLSCLSCKRKKIYQSRTKRSMSLTDLEFLSKLLKDIKIKKIHYFNQGEPFMSERIKDEIKIIKKHNPSANIITSTNGSINTRKKREAALLFDHIYFSLDGSDQKSAAKYQRGINFEKVYTEMKEIIKLRGSKKRPIIEWKYVLFRWNDNPRLIKNAIKLAKEANVDILSFWKTLSPLYGISYRYYSGFLQQIGNPSWKGREIDFRTLPSIPAQP